MAIVGGGYAGLSTALHLAERGVPATVLESGAIGGGASGRNGGQVLYGGKHSRRELTARFGEAAGERLFRFGTGAPDAAFGLIRRLHLQCDAMQAGSIYAADSQAGLEETRGKHQALQADGVAARWLDRAAIAEATASNAYLGGYFNPLGGSVQPLSLVRELARAAQAAGACIHEHSAALALQRQGADWNVRTARGSIRARKVLIATQGRPGSLYPALEGSVLPVWSFQVATDPLPQPLGLLSTGTVVSDTRRVLRYFRSDREGRLMMGGKGTLRSPKGPQSFALQHKALAHLYPQLAEQPIRWWWGGEVAVTLDRLPRLFTLGDGVLASVACNGKGVAWNVALGSVLADALTGAALDTLPLPPATPLQTIPFHFLKQAYSAAGSSWLRLLDGIDLARPSLSRNTP